MSGIPVTGVNEIILEVTDLAASERFYTEVLGFPVTFRWEGEFWKGREAVWVMVGDQTRIGLWKPQVGIARCRGAREVHYAMYIADEDYAAAVERIRSHGHHVDEVMFGDSVRSAYVADPDRHILELWTWDVSRGDAGVPSRVSEGVFGL